MEQISARLYIGSREDAGEAKGLLSSGITAVLKLTHGDPPAPYPEAITVAEYPLIDGPRNDFENFRRAVDGLSALLAGGETVLVHCSAGSSRSGAVGAAALARQDGIDVETALARIQREKPDVDPHPALLEHAHRTLDESARS